MPEEVWEDAPKEETGEAEGEEDMQDCSQAAAQAQQDEQDIQHQAATWLGVWGQSEWRD